MHRTVSAVVDVGWEMRTIAPQNVRFCSKIDMWVGVDALHDYASEKVGFEDLQVIEIFKGGRWLAKPPCHTHANDSSRRWPHKSTC